MSLCYTIFLEKYFTQLASLSSCFFLQDLLFHTLKFNKEILSKNRMDSNQKMKTLAWLEPGSHVFSINDNVLFGFVFWIQPLTFQDTIVIS